MGGINNITLIQGDCTTILNELVWEDNMIIVTDPPFNINYKYSTYKDKMTEEDYYNMLSSILMDRKSVVIHYPEQLHRLSIKLNTPPLS